MNEKFFQSPSTPEKLKEETTDLSREGQKSLLNINGIQIECRKQYFEYPESIQKETGILGYNRTIIDNSNLTDFIKKDYLSRYGINVEEFGFTGVESMVEFNKKVENLAKINSVVVNEALQELDQDILKEMLYSLSSGEYPNKCFTHEMGADYSDSSKKKKEFHEEFVKNKFFLQKIYDLDYIKKTSR